MPYFIRNQSYPQMTVVEPRETIELHWHYIPESAGDATKTELYWDLASVGGWTTPNHTIMGTSQYYELPANTWELDKLYKWRAVTTYDNAGTPATVETGNFMVDASGYFLRKEVDSADEFSAVDLGAPPPGDYEIRVRPRNEFLYGDPSDPEEIRLFNTSRFVKQSGVWRAVPVQVYSGTEWLDTKS